jgi:competence protein ComEC
MRSMRLLLVSFAFIAVTAFAAKPLEIFFIDVEGGQATLIVSPSRQSMLVDTGWPGFSNRDANRIAAAAKKAGVRKIDYVYITHFHTDHVGGAAQLAERIQVGTFVDKGKSVESGKNADEMMEIYSKALATSAENGAFAPSSGPAVAACANAAKKEPDPSDNAQSMGFVLTYGAFKFADLGDLTWNKEIDLVCPANRVGPVDVFLSSHHGLDQSNPPALLAALHPKVAIMNNGARKGGSPSAWQVIHGSEGLQDLWQVHFSIAGGKDNNVSDPFIANVDQADDGHYLLLSAESNGSFTVTNSRNKYSKTYAK